MESIRFLFFSLRKCFNFTTHVGWRKLGDVVCDVTLTYALCYHSDRDDPGLPLDADNEEAANQRQEGLRIANETREMAIKYCQRTKIQPGVLDCIGCYLTVHLCSALDWY
jgi:hypothetical protein